jgi:hypothetical protein
MAAVTTPAPLTAALPGVRRLAGIGAVGFAAIVAGTNLLVGDLPRPGIPLAEIAAWYAANGGRVGITTAAYAVNIVLLMLFASNVRELVRDSDAARPWTTMGVIGLTALAVSFGAVTAAQVALVELAGAGATPAFAAIWALHSAAFSVNVAVLAIAILGLSIGLYAGGLTPAWQRALGVTGAVLLVLGGMGGLGAGAESLLGLPGLGGFLIWLVWLTTTGVRLLRTR